MGPSPYLFAAICTISVLLLMAVCATAIVSKLDRLIEAVNDLAYDDDDDDSDDGDGDDDGEPLPAEDWACETVRFAS